MAVKLVVNGFFRSGTSVAWKIIKESNPELYVFYEPCHEMILERVKDFRRGREVDKVHNMRLWGEYSRVPSLMKKIRSKHPNLGKGNILPKDARAVVEYARIFHELDRDSVLQTNRWSLFLGELHGALGCGVIHMIRNPFDVYGSMWNVYMRQGTAPKVLLKKALRPFFAGRAFHLRRMFDLVVKKFGDPGAGGGTGAFDMFLAVWIHLNHHAIQAARRTGGAVLVYEAMTRDPERARGMIESRGAAFNHEGALRKSERPRFIEEREKEILLKKAGDMSLEEKMNIILEETA
ncbi:MAG: hypothetical protein ACNS63_06935 [Candidatus Nitrospinota bacterium M3_3B_026]